METRTSCEGLSYVDTIYCKNITKCPPAQRLLMQSLAPHTKSRHSGITYISARQLCWLQSDSPPHLIHHPSRVGQYIICHHIVTIHSARGRASEPRRSLPGGHTVCMANSRRQCTDAASRRKSRHCRHDHAATSVNSAVLCPTNAAGADV